VRYNQHSQIKDAHAFLSPSKPTWIDWDDDKLTRAYSSALAAQRGTDLHDLAHRCIRLKQRLPEDGKTLSLYVNDAIGFGLRSEQTLFYSVNCFGTADAIGFRANTLRVADYKSGVHPVKEKQLLVYAALFCLEYKKVPFDIKTELRVYQNNEVRVYDVNPVDLMHVMQSIITNDKRLQAIREEL
jgi:hypothetical protein